MNYIVLALAALGVVGGVVFWKLIKHFNYELNFRESLIFLISILVFSIGGLVDFSFLQKEAPFGIIFYGVVPYFLVLLVIYYIIRSVKLKKYIPMKVILAYALIMVGYFAVLIIACGTAGLRYVDGWGMFGVLMLLIMIYGAYFAALIFINFVLLCVACSSKRGGMSFMNVRYNFGRLSFYGYIMLTVFAMIGCIVGIGYYNEFNYKSLLERQKEIVMNYLNEEYPDKKFEITSTVYSGNGDFTFGYGWPTIRNKIVNKLTNQNFQIDVKVRDLTIYENSFRLIEQ